MTMPGLPKVPAANGMDITQSGEIVGLSLNIESPSGEKQLNEQHLRDYTKCSLFLVLC